MAKGYVNKGKQATENFHLIDLQTGKEYDHGWMDDIVDFNFPGLTMVVTFAWNDYGIRQQNTSFNSWAFVIPSSLKINLGKNSRAHIKSDKTTVNTFTFGQAGHDDPAPEGYTGIFLMRDFIRTMTFRVPRPSPSNPVIISGSVAGSNDYVEQLVADRSRFIYNFPTTIATLGPWPSLSIDLFQKHKGVLTLIWNITTSISNFIRVGPDPLVHRPDPSKPPLYWDWTKWYETGIFQGGHLKITLADMNNRPGKDPAKICAYPSAPVMRAVPNIATSTPPTYLAPYNLGIYHADASWLPPAVKFPFGKAPVYPANVYAGPIPPA